ncbi:hypothetical protein LSH36_285g03035, partial [Paralvinella palmiformis]
ADISVKQQLIFATQHQLQLLVRAKTLYVDATFHVIHKPFTLFLTINVFIRSGEGDNTKQILLAYVLMSDKSRANYPA